MNAGLGVLIKKGFKPISIIITLMDEKCYIYVQLGVNFT